MPGPHVTERQMRIYMNQRQSEPPAVAAARARLPSGAAGEAGEGAEGGVDHRDEAQDGAGGEPGALPACANRPVEPVFGIVKEAMGFRRFLLRGLEEVEGEWALVALAYNCRRLNNLMIA